MQSRAAILALLVSLFVLAGLAISGYLTWTAVNQDPVVGCDFFGEFDCDRVLAGPWSKWFGQPVSLLAIAVYLGVLVFAWWVALAHSRFAKWGLLSLSLAALGAGGWFVGLQATQSEGYCLYCLVVHACSLVIFLLAIALVRTGPPQHDVTQLRSLLGATGKPAQSARSAPAGGIGFVGFLLALLTAAAGVGGLIAGQVMSPPVETFVVQNIELEPSTNNATPSSEPVPQPDADPDLDEPAPLTDQTEDEPAPAEESDDAAVEGAGDFTVELEPLDQRQELREINGFPQPVNLLEMPLVGDTSAPHVLLDAMDYTCRHCRKMHHYLKNLQRSYPDQFVIVVYHTPIGRECNPAVKRSFASTRNSCKLAKLALRVWMLAPDRFEKFHNWLMEPEDPPSYSESVKEAMRLAGDDLLSDHRNRGEVDARIARQVQSFAQVGTSLPILLTPGAAIKGIPPSEERFLEVIRDIYGLEEPESDIAE